MSGFRALASSAPDAGLPPFERHLVKLIRLFILVQTAALALRVLVLPEHSAIGAKPAILWFLLPIAAILLAVPWGRLARTPLLLLSGLLVVVAIRSVIALQNAWIAGFEPWWTMPFVTMTMAITVGAAQLVHRERAAQAGMSGFLTKPVMRDELIRTILSQLPATQSTPGGSAPGRSAAQGPQGESTPHGSSATQKDTNTADSQQPDSTAMALDVELMLKQMHSSVGLARQVLPVVLQETPGTIKQLAEAVGKSDSDAVQKLAHLLKGRAASIAAVTMSEHCAALDLSARAGQLEKFAFLFNTICEDYLALEAEIKAWLAAHELVTSAKRPGLND